jgi:hypothetical protein
MVQNQEFCSIPMPAFDPKNEPALAGGGGVAVDAFSAAMVSA